ncbi:hypothetical protein C8R45DRAFT_482495 [Mycena sanguinolenta]|nr:hypothetical protein C8R45DRAFT_482495 [Mycena sanguinolenta]
MSSMSAADNAAASATPNESLFAALARMYYSNESSNSRVRKLNKSMISRPASESLVHVAHIGYDQEQGFTSTILSPSVLGQLEDLDIETKITKEIDFEGGTFAKPISSPVTDSLVHVAHIGHDEHQGFTSTGVDSSCTDALSQREDASIGKENTTPSQIQINELEKSMISGPATNSFVHVAHMGYNENRDFTSTNVDRLWIDALGHPEASAIEENSTEDGDSIAATVAVTPTVPKELQPLRTSPRRMHSTASTSASVTSRSRSLQARPASAPPRPHTAQSRPHQVLRSPSRPPLPRPQTTSNARPLRLPPPRPPPRVATAPPRPLPPLFRPTPRVAAPRPPPHQIHFRPLPRSAPPRPLPLHRPSFAPPRRNV